MEHPSARLNKDTAAQLARELRKAVLGHLVRDAVDPYPDEEALRGYQRPGARSALLACGKDGWHRWPLGVDSARTSPSEFSLARHAQEAEDRRARVAFAHELAVSFRRIFPQEVIIQIHLWVFWG